MRAAILLVVLCACTQPKNTFRCGDSSACAAGGLQGTCEPTGYCSFDDSSCPFGRRYGELSSPELAGMCVGGMGVCNDGLDGDNDGLVDGDDPGCASEADTDERGD